MCHDREAMKYCAALAAHAQKVKAFKRLARAQGLVTATPPPEARTRLRNVEAHCPAMLRRIVLHCQRERRAARQQLTVATRE
jgi:hypothetical protein